MEELDIAADCRSVVAPTLIVTGEPALDWVVPVNNTTEYLQLIRGARHVVLERYRPSGHDHAAGRLRRGRHSLPGRRSDAERRGRLMRLREIPGPAGPLEALLDEPPAAGGVNEEGLVERGLDDGASRARSSSRIRIRSTAGRCTRKWCTRRPRRSARIGCAVLRFNFRGVGTSAGAYDEGRGEMDDFRAAVDVHARPVPGRAALGGGHVVRRVDLADGRRDRLRA